MNDTSVNAVSAGKNTDQNTAQGVPVIIAAGRANGNGSFMARRMANRYHARLFMLCEYTVMPCTGCGACVVSPHRCEFDIYSGVHGKAGDDARFLLDTLCVASAVVLVAPVYFYGPPAPLKALIDRSQRVWEEQFAHTDTVSGLPYAKKTARPFGAVYTAARTRGDNLFTASRLIVDCFARCIGFTPSEPLCFFGIQGTTDAQDPERTAELDAWAELFFTSLEVG